MSGCEEAKDQGFSPTATASSSSARPFPEYSIARVDCSSIADQGSWLDLTLAPVTGLSLSRTTGTAIDASTVNDKVLKPSYGVFQPSDAEIGADHQPSPCTLPSRREQWVASDHQVNVKEPERHHTDQSSAEPRVFGCQFCTRKFYSSQALGGHQNAHKRERSAGRKGPKLSSPFLPVQSRFPGMFLHGGGPPSPASLDSCNNTSVNLARSLGIKAHSLIHKPLSFRADTPYRGPALPQAHSGWSPLIGQQPGVGRCEMASTASNRPAMVGVGRFEGSFGFGGGRFMSPFAEDEGSSFTWQSPSPNHSSSATDVRNWSRMGPNASPLHHHHHHHHQHVQLQQSSNSSTINGLQAGVVVMAAEPQSNIDGAQEGPVLVDLSLRL